MTKHASSKASVFTVKNGIFKFIYLEESFQKAPFSLTKINLSVGGRPKQREKDAFSNKNVLVWTRPQPADPATTIKTLPVDQFNYF